MPLQLCVLASGSSGNCSLLRTPAGVVMIDAGIGPRTTRQRLDGADVSIADIRAICLTHLDSDHFRPSWLGTLLNHGIRIYCHRSRAGEVLEMLDHESAGDHVVPFAREFCPLDGLTVRPISLAHDRSGSHGFVFQGFGCRIGYATDLGCVPGKLLQQFVDLDLLALESNYDVRMQLDSARPAFLKSRIMGGRGHLSNDQAYAAVCQILDRAQRSRLRLPSHIVLLHRSRQCNCPNLLRKKFIRDPRIAPRLTLAEQFQRTRWLDIQPCESRTGEQMALSFTP